jgi:ATP-dependent helicase/nuclease subunit A
MNRPVDWQEREQARDPNFSWIVQAPAGSGKTELLTQRMLGLLARVENPEEVIAITFTRKAAAEMNHRLVESLQAAAREPQKALEPHQQINRELALAVLENNGKRGWNLLEQPSRLRIRTIDSLCSDLARQLPILSGLGGGQQIAEDSESLYRIAAARTMAAIEDDGDELQPDVIRVLDRYDNQYDRLVDLLTSMLGHREQWIGHLLDLKKENGFDRGGLEDSLRVLIEAELRAARENLPDTLLAELPRYLNYAVANTPAGEAEVRALLDACGGSDCNYLDLPATADALSHWVTMIGFLLTKSGTWWVNPTANLGFPAPSNARGEEKVLRREWKEGFKELLDSLRGNDDLLDQFITIRKLPRPGYDDDAWESLESLMRIMIRAFQEWKVVMSETGEADFSEIAARAIQALGEEDEPSQLALRMDYRIEHLLVDEFQDTSLSQIRLLDRLTAGWSEGDGRTLFLVGDPMQSIYRFRKAEVSLFIEAFEGRLFRHIKLQPLQLRVNFRSTEPIVNWINRVFPDVMPQHSDPLKDAVHYSESSARPGAPANGTVSTHLAPERDDEAEARQVVEVIRQSDPEQSIAILVRSRRHAANVLALLDRMKEDDSRFRYQAIDFNPLARSPLVQDLVSLTLALTQPADSLAWLSVLRAPHTGLDLADLDALAGGAPGGIILDSLAASLDPGLEPQISLGNSGRQRLQRTAPVLLQAADRRGREPVRTLVEAAWTRLGGPACAQNASELDDAATYFDLLDSLENENLPIDRDTLAQRMENLHAQHDSLASDRLQVMTIYSAKGLQFDTVILPGLNRGTGADKGKLLHWFELAGQNRIVMSPMRNTADKERQKKEGDLIEFISDVEKRRQRLENGRLLYVAATRAVHSLHLFAAVKPKKNGEVKPTAGTLLGELWPAIREDQESLLVLAAAEQEAKTSENPAPWQATAPAFPQQYRRLAADWRLPPSAACVQQAGAEIPDLRDTIEFRWAGEETRLTGNLVHRLLQLIAEQGLNAWSAGGGMAGYENWCRQQLVSEGVQGEKADSIVALTSRAIENCLASEHGSWVLDSHEDARCELALTAVLDGQPSNLVLDRTFVADGARWIIDYKTSSHSGGDLEGFLQNEADRYREQLRRYREAVAINENRPIKTALYFPLLDRFREVD